MKQIIPARKENLVSITCDKCGKTYHAANDTAALMEMQEFLSYSTTGGYSSLIGDGEQWSIDLCQPCTLELLGQYIRKHGNFMHFGRTI